MSNWQWVWFVNSYGPDIRIEQVYAKPLQDVKGAWFVRGLTGHEVQWSGDRGGGFVFETVDAAYEAAIRITEAALSREQHRLNSLKLQRQQAKALRVGESLYEFADDDAVDVDGPTEPGGEV